MKRGLFVKSRILFGAHEANPLVETIAKIPRKELLSLIRMPTYDEVRAKYPSLRFAAEPANFTLKLVPIIPSKIELPLIPALEYSKSAKQVEYEVLTFLREHERLCRYADIHEPLLTREPVYIPTDTIMRIIKAIGPWLLAFYLIIFLPISVYLLGFMDSEFEAKHKWVTGKKIGARGPPYQSRPWDTITKKEDGHWYYKNERLD